MATQKRKKRRHKRKNNERLRILLSIVVVVLLGIVLIAQLKKDDSNELVKEDTAIEENAVQSDDVSVNETQKEESATEPEGDADQSVSANGETETNHEEAEQSQPEQSADAIAEPEKIPDTNTMNADGLTWTSFDGYTLGSVNGGTYGSLYTADQIRALDGTKQGYGQGVNVDESNRPVGAIWLQNDYGKYGAVYIAPESDQIYMTLDEGYENGYTSVILDSLKEQNCSAVFFVTMDYVKKNPELVKRMINEGHVVGNHSVNHKSMPTLSLEDASYEITELHKYMLENFGYEMYLFRPPMGEFSEQTLALAQSLGYRTMLWSYAYRDFDVDNQPAVSEAFSKVTNAKHGGAVYLLHAVSATNASIMADVINDFRNSGYTVGAFPR